MLGVMSGTSLDGLDISFCTIQYSGLKWDFEIRNSTTISYSEELKNKLNKAKELSGLDLALLDVEFGRFIGKECLDFINSHQLKIDYIASHGHTVHHLPNQLLTTQIGSGAHISAISKTPTICDFRTTDVANGGQGAPLVPIGDLHLFSEFDVCVNLGGFSNLTYQKDGSTIAFDVCPVNIVLNKLCESLLLPYDDGGKIASTGKVNQSLLNKLDSIDFYQQHAPKSLGAEWVDTHIFPLFNPDYCTTELIGTFTQHVANQLTKTLSDIDGKRILFSGGGAYNSHLIKLINQQIKGEIVIPDKKIIEYKEALIFAFLGVLRMEKQANCLSSVTGADIDSVGGCVYV